MGRRQARCRVCHEKIEGGNRCTTCIANVRRNAHLTRCERTTYLTALQSEEREARIRLYTERAAQGKPLFTKDDIAGAS